MRFKPPRTIEIDFETKNGVKSRKLHNVVSIESEKGYLTIIHKNKDIHSFNNNRVAGWETK
jgi:hypothetical protein